VRLPRPRLPRPTFGAVALVALTAAGAAAAISDYSNDESSTGALPPEASGGGAPLERRSFLTRVIPPEPERARREPGVPRTVADLARRLPLERKAAQLFLVGFRGRALTAGIFERLLKLDLGGIVIAGRNYESPQQLASLAGEALVVARNAKHVPPWVMASQEGGEFSEFPDLPPPVAPADLRDTREAGAVARATASTLRALGINGLLGPVVDVGAEEGPLGPEAYSDDPRQVAAFARATIAAYRDEGMFSAAKHFPGLGAASQHTDEGPASVGLTVDQLRERDLVPFRAAIAAGAPAVVLSHALYATDDYVTPGSLSKSVATGLLRGDLRFRGVAITDDLEAPAVTAVSSVPDAAIDAIKAGADMVFISGPVEDQLAAYVALLNAVRRGEVKRSRLDQAVLRVLTAKRAYGLLR
jgi:beta-N-acetylhexosaminidase